ncbi:MAG TPA: DUF1570 domain-containing protein [Polyangia bacterium]
MIALGAGLVAGCATVPPCPAKGGRTWRELTTDHFVLRTDLNEDDALRVVRTLEETRAAMLIGVWSNLRIESEVTPVFALDSRSELASYTGPLSGAKHQSTPPFPPFLVVPEVGSGMGPGAHAVRHELAHQLSRQVLAAQPHWFSEGVATFLETIRPDFEDDTRMVIGEADPGRYRLFRYVVPSSLEELLGAPPETLHERARFYATSWLLVHYLFNHRPEQLREFEHRLGALEPARVAFREAFPDLASGALPSVLWTYINGGEYVITRWRVPRWNGLHETRVLTDAEVHAVRALLRASSSNVEDPEAHAAAIASELDEAIGHGSPPLDALAVAFYQLNRPYRFSRAELASMAVATHPRKWMAWLMAADVAPGGSDERDHALHRALAFDPTEPEVLLRLAREHARVGRWQEVLGISSRILRAGVQHPDLWLMHLYALQETGRCDTARLWGAALEGYVGTEKKGDVARVRARPCREPADEDAAATVTSTPE